MNRQLILVPTAGESAIVAARCAGGTVGGIETILECCGFGLAAAAARTARLLATLRPDRVLLVGIAGRLDGRLPIGSAWWFDHVACHGIGAGSGADFIPASHLGWPQWPGDADDPGSAVGDVLELGGPGGPAAARGGLLLTACAASASAADVRSRRAAFPAAAAEDMEGFGVALACRLDRVPCGIVRGISNVAGDRDPAHWRIAAALEAAADLAVQLLAEAA